MPPVSGIDADSSANASAPQRTIRPPTIQTASIMVGSGTRVAMPAGVRKIPPPMVMPMTIPIELQSPRRRTSVGMARSVYDDARRGHYNYQVTLDAALVGSTIL